MPATLPEKRRALLAILLLVPAPSVGVLAAMWLWAGPVGQAIWSASKLYLALFPLGWHRLVERQPIAWSPPRHGGWGMGAATGLGIALALGLGWWCLGSRWVDLEAARKVLVEAGLGSAGLYLGACFYWITINSLIEEYVWRWFVFEKLEIATGSGRFAVLGSGLFFSLHHGLATASFLAWPLALGAALGCFIGGALWSWLYLRYRSIWPAYLSHAIVDVAVFAIGWHILFVAGR